MRNEVGSGKVRKVLLSKTLESNGLVRRETLRCEANSSISKFGK